MPGRARGESMYDNPEKLNQLEQDLMEVHTGLDPLLPEFVRAVIKAGGWYEITPLQQDRLGEYLTTEKSEREMAAEEGLSHVTIAKSNRRALEILHKYFVRVRPDEAKNFPSEVVTKGKDPGVIGGRPPIHGRYSKRYKEENQDQKDTAPNDITPMIEEV